MTPIPTTLEALTPAWLTETLCGAGHLGAGAVTMAEVTPVGQGQGVLCQLARIRLGYAGAPAGLPRTLVAKLATADPQTRSMVTLFRFYEREVRFYEELAPSPSMPLTTPRRYASAFDAGTGDFVLLLEDLGHLRLGDQLASCSPADVVVVIDELARLHAAWWESPRLAELAWMPVVNNEANKLGLGLYPAAWPVFLERFGAELPEAGRAVGERLGARVIDMLDEMAGGPATVCHGDLRLDNLFFAGGAAGPALTVIDWQIAGRGVGTFDVGYFMSQSLTPDVRRACEEDMLARYHAGLVARGVRGYDLDQCRADYRRVLLFCLVYPVMAGGMGDLVNERGHALALAMARRSVAAILDWNAGDLL